MSKQSAHMKLGMFYWPGGGQHMAAWRHPDAHPDFDVDVATGRRNLDIPLVTFDVERYFVARVNRGTVAENAGTRALLDLT